MKPIAGAAAIAAVSILISSSVALGDDRALSMGKARPSWAKVVVNQPTPKRGAYYKGISRTAFSNFEWQRNR
ncbi:hypothetical protein ABIE33_007096 [Ensifer sp. 4252]